MKVLRSFLVTLLAVATLGACAARATQEPPIAGADFILEIHNPMPHTMTVMYWVGGSQTTLGSLAANETRRFQLPNRGDDSARLTATDEGRTHTVDETIDLDKAEVIRWEIGD